MGTEYYGDTVITTTFTQGHPNHITAHCSSYLQTNRILYGIVACILVGMAMIPAPASLLGIPFIINAVIWIGRNTMRVRDLTADVEATPLETEGMIEKEWVALKPGQYPYPGGLLRLTGRPETFKVDARFVRRMEAGQWVRFAYTPKHLFVRWWQPVLFPGIGESGEVVSGNAPSHGFGDNPAGDESPDMGEKRDAAAR